MQIEPGLGARTVPVDGKPSVAQAWIAWNLEINPADLHLDTSYHYPNSARYRHPVLNEIEIERVFTKWYAYDMNQTHWYGPGFGSRRFLAFEKGYLGQEKPALWRPLQRYYYNAGADARSRGEWPEKDRKLVDRVVTDERSFTRRFNNITEQDISIIDRKTGKVLKTSTEEIENYDRR